MVSLFYTRTSRQGPCVCVFLRSTSSGDSRFLCSAVARAPFSRPCCTCKLGYDFVWVPRTVLYCRVPVCVALSLSGDPGPQPRRRASKRTAPRNSPLDVVLLWRHLPTPHVFLLFHCKFQQQMTRIYARKHTPEAAHCCHLQRCCACKPGAGVGGS